MYQIAIYIIGFIFCIIANIIFELDDEIPMLVCFWILSVITVPIAIFILMLYLIGILINAITKAIRKAIRKAKCELMDSEKALECLNKKNCEQCPDEDTDECNNCNRKSSSMAAGLRRGEQRQTIKN